MNKLLKFSVSVTAAALVALSMTACKHEHTWKWHRTETEHWQECTHKGCNEKKNYGTHDEDCKTGCETCAEYKVLAFGFADCIGASGVDDAHADFAQEASKWFLKKGAEAGYLFEFYDTYFKGWSDLTEENLADCDLVMLLNDKPSTSASQTAFKNYMDNGGACVAFHAAAFAWWDDPDSPPSEWENWYSNTLLRCGCYGWCERDSNEPVQGTYWNTWNPTSEPMTIETHDHFVTEDIEVDEYVSAPCEWYEWHNNLFKDDETTVLVSMNPTPQNPAGDDPRPDYAHQIWTAGHHAIAWANDSYNMVYMNWGHNLRSYNDGAEGKQSSTFSSDVQNAITLNAILGLLSR